MLILLPGKKIRGAIHIAHKDISVKKSRATVIEEEHYDSIVEKFVEQEYLTVEDFDVAKVRTDIPVYCFRPGLPVCYYGDVPMEIYYANMSLAIPLPEQQRRIVLSRCSNIDAEIDLDLDEIICDNITAHTATEAIEQNKIKFNNLSKEELKAWEKAIKDIEKPFSLKFWRIAYSSSDEREGDIWLGEWKWKHLWKGIWIAYVKRDGFSYVTRDGL